MIKKIKLPITDTQRLDWMIFNSGCVHHSKDGDMCRVAYDDDWENGKFKGPLADDARKAIDLAMKEDDKRTFGLAK